MATDKWWMHSHIHVMLQVASVYTRHRLRTYGIQHFSGIRQTIDSASYWNGIDVWIWMCDSDSGSPNPNPNNPLFLSLASAELTIDWWMFRLFLIRLRSPFNYVCIRNCTHQIVLLTFMRWWNIAEQKIASNRCVSVTRSHNRLPKCNWTQPNNRSFIQLKQKPYSHWYSCEIFCCDWSSS